MTSETYTPGYDPRVLAYMKRRTVESAAAFFTPLLKPSTTLLDCGCGPGTITVGLAGCIAPGRVTAIDQSDAQFETGRALAKEQGREIDFRAASIYELPFPDATFDAVFAHALFEHLGRHVDALREIHRVLKPGGFAGVRSPDWGGNLYYPDVPAVRRLVDSFQDLQRANGGDPLVGAKLPGHMRAAGFARTTRSASYEIYPKVAIITEVLIHRIEEQAPPGLAAADVAGIVREVREWSRHPDALFGQAFVEAIGWKA